MKRLFLLVSGAVLAGSLALAGGTGPAGAVSPAKTGPVSSSASAARPNHSAPALASSVITCTPNVQNPHNSTHVGGTVNVVVTLSCTGVVPYISIRAALYRNGALVKDSGAKAVYGSSFAQNNAAVACSSATYQGWMSYYVEFPAGYSPPSGASSGFGNSVPITC
jgi:hypothetical protein